MKRVKKIERLAKKVLEQIRQMENPFIEIPIRTLKNIEYDEKTGRIILKGEKGKRYFLRVGQARKFMQTLLVAAKVKELLKEDVSISIRDLYYALKRTIPGTRENTFDEQNESDPIIEDLEVTLNMLREEMHLTCDRKGYAAGNITIVDAGDELDLRRMGAGGWGIPSNVEKDRVKFKECEAEFVLVVEKDAVWQRLNEDKFWKKHNCILITTKGQAARGCRRLIHRLHHELKLPVYVLTDADPWGMYIYSVIKRGSINLAYLSEKLATPDAKFIGLSIFDVDKFGISKNVTIKLKEIDKKRIAELMNYEWFKHKRWQKEFKEMLRRGYKLELEALSNKGIRFISDVYLPTKLKEGDFLP